MAGTDKKSLDSPDKVQTPPRARIELVNVGDAAIARLIAEPGLKWSEHIKPIVGTDSCQQTHIGYMVSGRMHVLHDDGTEAELGPGDAYKIAPGHDAWVVGDEPAVSIEFAPEFPG